MNPSRKNVLFVKKKKHTKNMTNQIKHLNEINRIKTKILDEPDGIGEINGLITVNTLNNRSIEVRNRPPEVARPNNNRPRGTRKIFLTLIKLNKGRGKSVKGMNLRCHHKNYPISNN